MEPKRTQRPKEAQGRHVESARAPRARQRRRKRKLKIFYFLLFLIVLGSAVTLSLTVLFQISSIEVTGTSRYAQAEIIKISNIQKGENLFLAKTGQAEAAIAQKLPYIGKVKVSRRLPANISIQVEAAKADAAVAFGNSYALLTGSGKVLELVAQPPEGCTLVAGLALSAAPPGKQVTYKDEKVKELYQQLITAITGNQLASVTKIDISDPYRILMVYDGRITMNLGSSADLDYKIRFGKTILDGKNGAGEDNIGKSEKGVLNLSGAKEDDRAYFDPNGVVSSTAPKKSPPASSSGAASSAAISGKPIT